MKICSDKWRIFPKNDFFYFKKKSAANWKAVCIGLNVNYDYCFVYSVKSHNLRFFFLFSIHSLSHLDFVLNFTTQDFRWSHWSCQLSYLIQFQKNIFIPFHLIFRTQCDWWFCFCIINISFRYFPQIKLSSLHEMTNTHFDILAHFEDTFPFYLYWDASMPIFCLSFLRNLVSFHFFWILSNLHNRNLCLLWFVIYFCMWTEKTLHCSQNTKAHIE